MNELDEIVTTDPLNERAADLLVEHSTSNYIVDGIGNGPFSDDLPDDALTPDDGRRQMNIVRRGVFAEGSVQSLERTIRNKLPFKGNYATRVEDRRLMIPTDYIPLLEFGGVVTYSTDEHLLLFGKFHWQRMEQLITRELGMHADRDSLARHFFRGKMEFDALNPDGSITLTKSLAKYADIKDKAILVGVIYFAEIHNPEKYKDDRLEPRDISKLSSALA